METPASTFVYRHTRLGILTEAAGDVVDLTDGLDSLLSDVAMQTGLVNVRSLDPGTGIIVGDGDHVSAAQMGPGHSTHVAIVDGRLQLKAAERVLLVDFCGPGARQIAVVIVGEGRR